MLSNMLMSKPKQMEIMNEKVAEMVEEIQAYECQNETKILVDIEIHPVVHFLTQVIAEQHFAQIHSKKGEQDGHQVDEKLEAVMGLIVVIVARNCSQQANPDHKHKWVEQVHEEAPEKGFATSGFHLYACNKCFVFFGNTPYTDVHDRNCCHKRERKLKLGVSEYVGQAKKTDQHHGEFAEKNAKSHAHAMFFAACDTAVNECEKGRTK